MDSAAVYLALPEPDRAQHLWRYTPWHRIHPTGKHADLPESTGPPTLTLSLLDGEPAVRTERFLAILVLRRPDWWRVVTGIET